MKITNTIWEKKNLGIESCDILLEQTDIEIDKKLLSDEINDYIVTNDVKYVVLRFDSSLVCFEELANFMDFKFIECMLRFSISNSYYKLNDNSMFNRFNDISYKISTDIKDYEFVLEKISEGIFTTDRIAIDKHFGTRLSNHRYYNYINSIKNSNKYKLLICYKNNEAFGFDIRNVENETYVGILGGLFKKFQSQGLGLIWEKMILDAWLNECKSLITDVSANNIQVVKTCEYFGFRIKQFTYVYVKHII